MRTLGLVLVALSGYGVGIRLGVSAGRIAGRAECDWEWARMLENGMVGPGSTARPGAGSALGSVRVVGGA